ncbi:MAG: hypothetical protein ACFFD4_23300 [Candidatus Odinarchaeota archaeon]
MREVIEEKGEVEVKSEFHVIPSYRLCKSAVDEILIATSVEEAPLLEIKIRSIRSDPRELNCPKNHRQA